MNKTKKWIVTAAVLVLFIGAGLAYNAWKNRSASDVANIAPVTTRTSGTLNVSAVVIREQSLTDVLYTTGSLLPDEEVDLSFQTSGMITSINFQEGSLVKKNQLLAKVNDAPLLAQLSRYESQLKLAENRLYRQSTLLERDAVSQEAFEQAKTELAILNADIDLVKTNIDQTELRAPFEGVIGLRSVSEGAYATPSTMISTLTKLSPLKIEFSVPERYASQIRPGTNLTFEVDGSLRTYQATVYATESQVDVSTRTLTVRANYPNSNHELLPGRFANIEIKMTEIPNAIAIPSQALIPEMGIDKVYLYKNGTAEPVEVRTGMRTESQIQIVQGLTVGDTLIISGTLQLRTGLPVVLDNIE